MTGVESAAFPIGARVRMTWTGGTRDGIVVGEEYADALPTGARFVPVQWDDGSRDNVDTRVLSGIERWFAECPDCGGHLYAIAVADGEPAWTCVTRTCTHEPLADRDVYLEHDERHAGTPDDVRPELLALCIYRADETDGE
jgi:hypothetical protein